MAETTWAGMSAVAVVAAMTEVTEMIEMNKVAEVKTAADDVGEPLRTAQPPLWHLSTA